MSPRTAGAVVLGLALASLPFVRYRFAAPHPTAHADHRARHGGVVGMFGDLHVEVATGAGDVELWVTDAWRRPLAVEVGRLESDDGRAVHLAPRGDRLVGTFRDGRGRIGRLRGTIRLADGRVVDVDFLLAPKGR